MNSIVLNNQIIEYNIKRCSKRNINVRINPDLTLAISAPRWVLKAEIEHTLYNMSKWILKNLERQKNPPKNKKVNILKNGHQIWFKGELYQFYYKQADKNSVNIVDDMIIVYSSRVDDLEYSKGVFLKWLKERAKNEYSQLIEEYRNKMLEKYRIPEVTLQIRAMKSRWGTCAPSKRKITLNLYLMFVPHEYIECIVLHELTHLLEVNHNDHFYGIMKEYMPKCKQFQRELNKEYNIISKDI